jgi:hypothetical protein
MIWANNLPTASQGLHLDWELDKRFALSGRLRFTVFLLGISLLAIVRVSLFLPSYFLIAIISLIAIFLVWIRLASLVYVILLLLWRTLLEAEQELAW